MVGEPPCHSRHAAERLQLGQQFGHAEGLGNVFVRPGHEPVELIHQLGLGTQHQDLATVAGVSPDGLADLQTSRPPGIITSSSTTSGLCSLYWSRPLRPFTASNTSQSMKSSAITINCRTEALSSMIRIFMLLPCLK